MDYYYIDETDNRVGPITLDELKNSNINHDTLIWNNTMSGWSHARYVNELKDYLVNLPPVNPMINERKSEYSIKEYINIDLNTIGGILVILLFIYYALNSLHSDSILINMFMMFTSYITSYIPLIISLQIKNKLLKNISIIASILLIIKFTFTFISFFVYLFLY